MNRDSMGKFNAASNQNIQLWLDCRLTDYLAARPTGMATSILLPGMTIYEPSR